MLSHDPYDPETNSEGKIVFYPKLVFPESFLAVQLSRCDAQGSTSLEDDTEFTARWMNSSDAALNLCQRFPRLACFMLWIFTSAAIAVTKSPFAFAPGI